MLLSWNMPQSILPPSSVKFDVGAGLASTSFVQTCVTAIRPSKHVAHPPGRGGVRASAEAPAAEGQKFGVFKLAYDTKNEDLALTKSWKKPIRVAVTGASGNIANHLL